MCGIAGWIDFKEKIEGEAGTLAAMSETLARRGPDAKGAFCAPHACLLHRRLIVVDPENGLQPMIREKGGEQYVLTYNGELYNTEELRKELLAKGYRFEGHSDTEVLLLSYIEWKEACVEKFNGIFAFGIYCVKEETLFLARDRIGVKPLFFYEYDGGLIFGSEIKTLLANPKVRPQVAMEGLYEIFLLGPARSGGNGVFRGVKELKPGECALFSRDGLRIRKYWELHAEEHTDTMKQTLEKTRFYIIDAIRRQLVSDVPLCCFLSGGLDSSLISKIAADEYARRGKGALTTYSVDYEGNDANFTENAFQPDPDSRYTTLISDFIGSRHREVILQNGDLVDALYDSVTARDLPGMTDVDSSLLLFSREIKKSFTVAVSGECADEIFGGYPWYHNPEILFSDTFPWSRSLELRKSILKPGVLGEVGDDYVRQKYLDTVNRTPKLPGESRTEARMREMFLLNFDWFMQTLLDRKDRMSMYCGLEVRVPFCDYRLVEYAFNMPWRLKAYKKREKGIVREAMRGFLPDEILWRKKSPYPKTFDPAYFAAVKERVFALLNEKSSVLHEIANPETLEHLAGHPDELPYPWYGQLMRTPQVFAYLLQVDDWFKKYKVQIV